MEQMNDAVTKTYNTTDDAPALELDRRLGVRREVSIDELRDINTSFYGDALFVFAKNTEVSAWAAGDVITRTATLVKGYHGTSAGTSSTAGDVLGVAQHAIPAGYWGWILRRGMGVVAAGAGAAITTDTDLIESAANAGTAIDFTDGEEERVFGHSLAAIDAGATGLAMINLP